MASVMILPNGIERRVRHNKLCTEDKHYQTVQGGPPGAAPQRSGKRRFGNKKGIVMDGDGIDMVVKRENKIPKERGTQTGTK